MAGRSGEFEGKKQWNRLVYPPCLRKRPCAGFSQNPARHHLSVLPQQPHGHGAFASGPSGSVDYARRVRLRHSVHLYEALITDSSIPHSIYEPEGAQEVAVEFRSSKTAGFTGLRCAYTVVLKALQISDGKGGKIGLNAWCEPAVSAPSTTAAPTLQRRRQFPSEGREQVMDVIQLSA